MVYTQWIESSASLDQASWANEDDLHLATGETLQILELHARQARPDQKIHKIMLDFVLQYATALDASEVVAVYREDDLAATYAHVEAGAAVTKGLPQWFGEGVSSVCITHCTAQGAELEYVLSGEIVHPR